MMGKPTRGVFLKVGMDHLHQNQVRCLLQIFLSYGFRIFWKPDTWIPNNTPVGSCTHLSLKSTDVESGVQDQAAWFVVFSAKRKCRTLCSRIIKNFKMVRAWHLTRAGSNVNKHIPWMGVTFDKFPWTLTEMHILIWYIWGGAWNSALSVSSQEMTMLAAPRPFLQQRKSRGNHMHMRAWGALSY